MNISKELLSEVLNVNVQTEIHEDDLCSDNMWVTKLENLGERHGNIR